MHWRVNNCEPGHFKSERTCEELYQACIDNNKSVEDCYADWVDTEHWWHTMIWVSLGLGLPGILLHCLSFWWGVKLYNALKEGQVIVQVPAQVATVGMPVQPVRQ